jgi:hypothetical protein
MVERIRKLLERPSAAAKTPAGRKRARRVAPRAGATRVSSAASRA